MAGVGALAVIGVGGIVTAEPAHAHPFGDPQTVAISLDPARDEVVRVRWKVGGLDDLTLLGVSLGVLPKHRVMLDGAAFFEARDAKAIGPSKQFSEYLLRQIKVAGNGQDCAGKVDPPTELAKFGVEIKYTCPTPVAKAKVTVRTLTDLNEAYRTLATGPDGDRTIYTKDQDSYEWTLDRAAATAAIADADADAGRSAAIQLTAVAGGVALAATAAVFAVRRRRAAAAREAAA